MDTFTAMALASLPPSQSVMCDEPRSRSAFIINQPMWKSIIGTGGIFFLILLVLLYHFEHTEITCLIQIGNVPIGTNTGLTPYELSPIIIADPHHSYCGSANYCAFSKNKILTLQPSRSVGTPGASYFSPIAMPVPHPFFCKN